MVRRSTRCMAGSKLGCMISVLSIAALREKSEVWESSPRVISPDEPRRSWSVW